MSQIINTNSLSLVAQNNLNKSQTSLGTAIQRLSSGLRINGAKDDAAGQAITNRFTASISGLTQASRNANDGISIAQTTEGALNEINDNLQNIRRLTVQAQNSTNSSSDRQSIQDEIDARLKEINRISDQTEFNGVKVLSQDQTLSIQVGANDGETIDINLSQMNAATLGMKNFSVAEGVDINTLKAATTADIGEGYTYDLTKITDTKTGGSVTPTKVMFDSASGKAYATDGTDYYELTDKHDGTFTYDSTTKSTAPATATTSDVTGKEATQRVTIDQSALNGKGTLKTDGKNHFYLDDGAGHLTKVKCDIDKTNKASFKVKAEDTGKAVSTVAPTTDPIKALDMALSQVDKLRSSLGAVQNRFDSVISNLNNTVNNLSQSRSRILDADFASEVSEMSRSQILQSAGITVLAQANQVPQNVLQLLR
ncbi:TPA: FliC/FljB family flagellin [Salmonella enterica]|uniref:Flagellin n=1 Tax=Salmonella enterica TaxID=28901 RepID=A0A756YI56_SALER|nr:flagellin FliC [Salmonella enterica subsp. enterica serovar Richmond]HAG0390758.1 FliC/FljB family flagellin [Salmonella enterica]